ncbi:MAG: plasmid pRiA4b ORF-3 family protein [candidate division NC10 bacterium]|nr:plasmid pRiA4b ORF-3 family protein [candidate division NC10 bacterium]
MKGRFRVSKGQAAKHAPGPAYQLKVTLLEVEPPVWRQILVPGNVTLDRLHIAIQKAMGWTDSHLHEFEVGDQRYGDPDPEDPDRGLKPEWLVTLQKAVAAEGARFEYLYDFGDTWKHEIQVESIEVPRKPLHYPVCLAGERSCPPEDCGGPYGYADFLEAIRNPRHREHKQMLAWVGGAFDPEAFDLTAVNRKLRLLK